MSKSYEPENQFLERLEWQLSSEYRRTDRLKPAHGKVAVSRRMVAVSLMVGVLMTGVAAIKATEVIRDSWRKKIEIARIETEVKLKQTRLESTRAIVSRIETQFANGLIQEEEYQMMLISLRRAELDLRKSQLKLEEVSASGKAPRDELYAPVVRGTDYVSERLKLEIQELELDQDLHKDHFMRAKERVEAGVLNENELDYLQSTIEDQKTKIANINKKLQLRERFVAGDITAQEVEIEERMTIAEKNFSLAQSKVDNIVKQIKYIEDRVAAGLIYEMELTQMQYALNAAQAELDLAALEIDVLKNIK